MTITLSAAILNSRELFHPISQIIETFNSYNNIMSTTTTSATTTTFDVGITTLTNVDAIARIAYDVRDMAASISQGNYLDARRIYENGKNSPQYDMYGNEMDDLLSLQRMAKIEADEGMGVFKEDPSYMFQVLGMADIGQSISDTIALHGGYADTYIMEELFDSDDGNLAAQASTILVVSMYASHMLWDGLQDCVAVKNGYVPEEDQTGKINPKQSFDNFIALYVGAGQTLAPDWQGDMLYELAQAGGDLFDTVDSNGEALVNSDIRESYQQLQRLMSEEDYCQRDESVESAWRLVNHILSRMYVPMVQMLIHSMKQETDAHKVRMYSMAVIPQLSQCTPSIHQKLKEYLLDNQYKAENFPRILELLQQSYDCLGFSCQDVGAYNGDEVAECAEYETSHPLASFIPKTDVRALSKVDLDILAIDHLLKFPSDTKNAMAQFYYKYGRAGESLESSVGYSIASLQDMARLTEQRQFSPYYNDYIQYFKGPLFADNAIMGAFDDTENDQRRAYIVSLIRNTVIPEFMMGLLGLALKECKDVQSVEPATMYLDAFAALYIGSLEGIKPSGSDNDGMMMWALATNRARQFNTQNKQFGAKINDEMTDLLYAGQTQLERNDCANFETTLSRTLHLMLLPMIQNAIWYAIRNEEPLSTDEDSASGMAAAQSLLPIVSKYDKDAASIIDREMVANDSDALGPQSVANAFYKVMDDIGYDCAYLGQAEGIDPCEQYKKVNASNAASTMSWRLGATFIVIISAISSFVLA